MLELKLCNINDAVTISEMSNVIWHECYEEMLSYEQRVYMLNKFLTPKCIKQNIEDNYKFYFIYYNNKLAAFFSYKEYNDYIYISKLYSYKEFRGKGIFHFVIDFFNCFKKDLKLNTCKTNKTLQIYLHMGFEIYSEEKHDIGQGYYMDDYNLIKKFE